MKRSWIPGLAAAILLTVAVTTPVVAAEEETWDGLVKIEAKRVQAAYLLPGAEFQSYNKVIIDPPRVEFRKNWQRDINRRPTRLSGRLNATDVENIRSAFADGFEEILAAGFAKAGWEVGVADGPDVLRLTPLLVNVYVNAPDKPTAGRTYTYTVQAGEATVALEIRDAETGQLLGRAVDRRYTVDRGNLMML
ncbi:MAG: DUF3313 domain-containing protein, partial [Gammaproteobacteria bacterium]|nr:DUF3313 domain-containing protein [Gammaproteobacteria bacterium]